MMNHRGYGAHTSAVTTLNPSDKAANIVLSAGNLQATTNSGTTWTAVRATTNKSAGKFYYEVTNIVTITFPGVTGVGVGIANSTFNLDVGTGVGSYLGYDNQGIGFFDYGAIWSNGLNVATDTPWETAGDMAAVAVDIGAKLFWARQIPFGNWNGNPSADPATGVGGISFPSGLTAAIFPAVCCLGSTDPETIKINFGATTFTGSVPSGFSAWG